MQFMSHDYNLLSRRTVKRNLAFRRGRQPYAFLFVCHSTGLLSSMDSLGP